MPIAAIGINQAKLPAAQGGDEERTGARVPGDALRVSAGGIRREFDALRGLRLHDASAPTANGMTRRRRCNKKEKRLKRNMSMTLIRTRIARVGSRRSRHQPGKRQCATKKIAVIGAKENRPVRAVEVTVNRYFRAS